MSQWYMHNPESVPKNKTHKLLLDLEIQTDNLISAKQPDLLIVYKKENLSNSGFCRPCKPLSKIKRKWKER